MFGIATFHNIFAKSTIIVYRPRSRDTVSATLGWKSKEKYSNNIKSNDFYVWHFAAFDNIFDNSNIIVYRKLSIEKSKRNYRSPVFQLYLKIGKRMGQQSTNIWQDSD